jgi:hypothetical protein
MTTVKQTSAFEHLLKGKYNKACNEPNNCENNERQIAQALVIRILPQFRQFEPKVNTVM